MPSRSRVVQEAEQSTDLVCAHRLAYSDAPLRGDVTVAVEASLARASRGRTGEEIVKKPRVSSRLVAVAGRISQRRAARKRQFQPALEARRGPPREVGEVSGRGRERPPIS